ncbi:MAG: DUF1828 domain-containing protein [Methanomicrobium sp.]|nr:DUF1828 domain-containing protein [Methanomicrobium sp.]
MTAVQPDFIQTYLAWLKKDLSAYTMENGWSEITTPFLDIDNDCIQIYVRQNDDGTISLTDGGETLQGLKMSGCDVNTQARSKIIDFNTQRFGTQRKGTELTAVANMDNFAQKKNDLIQTILAIGDITYTAYPTVKNLFFEEIERWLKSTDIRYLPNVKILGKSGVDHAFDFVIPHSVNAPDRYLNACNNPRKADAENYAFQLYDINQLRGDDIKAYIIVNDERKIGRDFEYICKEYNIDIVRNSQRDQFVDALS